MQFLRCLFLLGCVLVIAAPHPVDASVVAPIEVYAVGAVTSPGTLTFVDNTTSWNVSVPSSTITVVNSGLPLGPSNIGLSPGDTLNFSGFSDPSLPYTTIPAVASLPNLLTFTTSAGNFFFSPIRLSPGDCGPTGCVPFSTARSDLIFYGDLTSSNPSLTPTRATFFLFFNANSTFPNGQFSGAGAEGAAWYLLTFPSSVPEPASLSVWSLMAIGMLAYRSRSNRSVN